jgi:phosphatidylglycerol:prolipoprotein diacylglycerol transferase
LLGRELRRSGLPESALDAAVFGLLGGLAGAKLLWVVEHAGEAPLAELIVSRGGLSWFGGFAGGLLVGLGIIRRRGLSMLAVLSAATPALAIGHAIGRVGCFLVGDDYGRPTGLPWGIAFPEGLPPTDVPVHPTQLYEALGLVPLAVLMMRWRAAGRSDRFVVGSYLVLAGALRFLIEFVRVNEPVIGTLSVAQVASMSVIVVGLVLLGTDSRPAARRRPQRRG